MVKKKEKPRIHEKKRLQNSFNIREKKRKGFLRKISLINSMGN